MTPQEEIDALLAEARQGADASAARSWLDKYLWLKIWDTIRKIANCPPEQHSTGLIALRYRLGELLLIAQETGMDIIRAQEAANRLKEKYTSEERRGRA